MPLHEPEEEKDVLVAHEHSAFQEVAEEALWLEQQRKHFWISEWLTFMIAFTSHHLSSLLHQAAVHWPES